MERQEVVIKQTLPVKRCVLNEAQEVQSESQITTLTCLYPITVSELSQLKWFTGYHLLCPSIVILIDTGGCSDDVCLNVLHSAISWKHKIYIVMFLLDDIHFRWSLLGGEKKLVPYDSSVVTVTRLHCQGISLLRKFHTPIEQIRVVATSSGMQRSDSEADQLPRLSRSRINRFTPLLPCIPLWKSDKFIFIVKLPSAQICMPYIQGDQKWFSHWEAIKHDTS